MKVSVIIPVYNVEEYLCECIDSVLAQTHDRFEIILIDDGSTDNSGRICDSYVKKYPDRITVVHTENKGPLHARISGIQEAHGDFLVFLDSDDCLRRDALMILKDTFTEYGCDMVFFSAEKCEDFPSIDIKYPFKNEQVFDGEQKKQIYNNIVAGKVTNSLCLKAVKRKCTKIPEYYSEYENIKHGEDLLLSACFITNCEKIICLDQGLYHYRMRQGSAIHSFDVKRPISLKTVHTELEKYIDLWNVPELHRLHNSRKVKGWVDTLILLLDNKHSISAFEYQENLKSMAQDAYFRCAYAAMDASCLSNTHRIIAKLLYKERYSALTVLVGVNNLRKRFHRVFRRK